MRFRVALALTLAGLTMTAAPADAALTVANTNDSGPGSLRQALIEAPPGETIVVPAGTYSLTTDPLEIVKSVTIAGHDAADTTIRAGIPMGVVEITGPLDATISGVTIRDGYVGGGVGFGAGIQSLQANLTIRNAVLTNNTVNTNGAAGVSGGVALGGAIWASEGSLNLFDCTITNNVATAVGGSEKNGGVAQGGGVFMVEGPATVANTTISGNRLDARGGQGPPNPAQNGGVAIGGGIAVVEGDLSFHGGEASANTVLATGGSGDNGGVALGGGIEVVGGSATVANAKFNGNLLDARGGQGPPDPDQNGGVALGGGIWVSEGNLSLSSGEASGNTVLATGGSGDNGGVALGGGVGAASPAATISSSTVSGNTIDARGGQGPADPEQSGGVAEGGGLWLSPETAVATPSSVTGSTFASNSADGSAGPGAKNGVVQGGGVWAGPGDAPVSIANSTIAFNVARHQAVSGGVAAGGGLAGVVEAPGSLELTSVTIAGNRLDSSGSALAKGGNLFWTEASTIRNSIVAGGAGPAGSENCSDPAKVSSLGFNLESSDQCGFHAAGDLINRDPLLGPLQSNGGVTQTMVPASTSPAIDQGAAFGLAVDQRGVVRPIDLPTIPNSTAPGSDGSDIGAVELQPSNAFTLGKLKRNKRKGTATLAVHLPQPSAGTLTLSGKGLKTRVLQIAGQSEVKLKVAGKKGVRKALRKKGRKKVAINVTYAPTGNSAATQSRKAKLVKKKKKKRKRGKGKKAPKRSDR